MTSYDNRAITLAVGLSCLAGYVDASGFLATGGIFVSFMSGNSTKLSVAFAENRTTFALLTIGVVALFVLGVVAGSVVSRVAGDRRKPRVLLIVTLLLTAAAVFHTLGITYASTAFMVVAMGMENTVFQRDGEVSIGLTYMTGTLVKLGQHLAARIFGEPKKPWWPFAVLWLGLTSGAVLGALGHNELKGLTLWPAVLVSGLLCLFSIKIRPATPAATDSQ